jgi:hypothetical protein
MRRIADKPAEASQKGSEERVRSSTSYLICTAGDRQCRVLVVIRD